ncbi:MAG: ribosomal protein S18-alanine N-acetyltransferase [Anaerolineae bacterium]
MASDAASTAPAVRVERMRERDVARVAHVECLGAPLPRSEASIRRDFQSNSDALYLVARLAADCGADRTACFDGRAAPLVVGYACLWLQVDVAHVIMITVLPEWRRHGVGRALLSRLVEEAARLGAVEVTLEVRETNGAARRLYSDHGFEEVGRRPRYYPDTGEDAILMTAPVGG